MARSGLTYYYVTESPGHVTGLVDRTGAVAAQYSYGAFGAGYTPAIVGAPNGWVNRLQFGAREYDAETGLYYNRARYYDPALGRFLSPDPSGLAGGVNWYAYAGNDPVNHTDPTGLDYSCVNYGGGGYVGYAGATSANAAFSWSGRFPSNWVCSGMDAAPGGAAAGPTASNWEAFQMYANASSGGGSPRPSPAVTPNSPIAGYPAGLGVIGAQSPYIFRGPPNGYQLSRSGQGIRFFGEDGIATVEYELKGGLHAHDFIDGVRQSHELGRTTVTAEELGTARSILLRHLQEVLSTLLQGRLFPSVPFLMVNPCATGQFVFCSPGPI